MSVRKALLDYCCSQTIRKWGFLTAFPLAMANLLKNKTGQMFSSLLHLRVNVHSAEVAYSPPEISSHLMFWTLPPTERCHIHHSLSKCYCFKPSCINHESSFDSCDHISAAFVTEEPCCKMAPVHSCQRVLPQISLHDWACSWYKLKTGI